MDVKAKAIELGGGRTVTRVRLADLREALPKMSRGELDAELLRLQKTGEIELLQFEDPTEKTRRDDEAAIHLAGIPHQILYVR